MNVNTLLNELDPQYTTWSGFAKRPVRSQQIAYVSTVQPLPRPEIPYVKLQPASRPLYTTEQLQRMQDAAAAAKHEITTPQGREDGDGYAPDLEQEALEIDATDKAVDDAYKTGDVNIKVEKATGNNAGVLGAALLAYFLFF